MNVNDHDQVVQSSHDTDDFIMKMMLNHNMSLALVAASMLARLARLAIDLKEEEGMLRLVDSIQTTLQISLDNQNPGSYH